MYLIIFSDSKVDIDFMPKHKKFKMNLSFMSLKF